MLIESDSGQRLLIDCGTDIRRSLFSQGHTHSDINAVYISHLHCDHAGGLEWLGFSKRFIDCKRPLLYISTDLVNPLWNSVLCGGMSSLENKEATLSDFFDIQDIQNNCFIWENYLFELIKTPHYFSNKKIMPSYGLFISNDSHKLFLTTDTRFAPDSLQNIYDKSDLIFQDCETSEFVSGQHSRFEELTTLSSETKKKMWLYDYNDGELPDGKREGFQGFIIAGQSFNF
ncbi:MAG: MBL fold metallo-hydrolase [Tatlockia sp.]|nr:MBL fold metallo-hydrolase [Tatlockia sp.]